MTRVVNAVMVTTVLGALAGCDNPLDTSAHDRSLHVLRRDHLPRRLSARRLHRAAGAEGRGQARHGRRLRRARPRGLRRRHAGAGRFAREAQGDPGSRKTSWSPPSTLILPKDFLDDLENFLEQLLPLHDDGTMDQVDPRRSATCSAPCTRIPTSRRRWRGWRCATAIGPPRPPPAWCTPSSSIRNIDDFLGKLLGLIAPGGDAEARVEAGADRALQGAAHLAAGAQPGRSRAHAQARRSTSSSRPTPISATAPGAAAGAARLPRPGAANTQGTAAAWRRSSTKTTTASPTSTRRATTSTPRPDPDVAAPFPEAGRRRHAAARQPRPRAHGAQTASLLYKYLDLDCDGHRRHDPRGHDAHGPKKDITLGLVLRHLGAARAAPDPTKMYLDPAGGMMDSITYNGFDTSQSAVLDLLHAFVQMLGDPNADQTLQSAGTLLNKYESQTARLIGAMFDAYDRRQDAPRGADPRRPRSLYDDLMPLILRILRVTASPRTCVKALQNPHVKGFAPMIALMQSRIRSTSISNLLDFSRSNRHRAIRSSATSTHRAGRPHEARRRLQPLDHAAHRAPHPRRQRRAVLQQRGRDAQVLGIILETDAKCKLFEIDDLALFYVLNMASDRSARDANAAAPKRAPISAATSPPATSSSRAAARRSSAAWWASTASGSIPRRRRSTARCSCARTSKSQFMQDTTDDIICTRRRQVHRRARQVDLGVGDHDGEQPVGPPQRQLLRRRPAARRRLRQARRVPRVRRHHRQLQGGQAAERRQDLRRPPGDAARPLGLAQVDLLRATPTRRPTRTSRASPSPTT